MQKMNKMLLAIRQWLMKYTDIDQVTNKGLIVAAVLIIAAIIAAGIGLAVFKPANM